MGIIFGSNEYFPEDFKNALRQTGVLHVIAASGMNVAFFTGAVMFSLGKVFSRRKTLLLSIFVVICYSFLVGFEPSILRASVMSIIAITASFFGRQNLALFSLFMAGVLMLFFSPSFFFDVGFQLSFLATLGILVIGPQLGELKWFYWLREDFRTTFSAQLATLPILLGTFGSVGVLGLLVNLLVLWTIPILMILGCLAVVIGLFVPFVGKLFLFFALPFLLVFEYIVSFFWIIWLGFGYRNVSLAVGSGILSDFSWMYSVFAENSKEKHDS